MKALDPLEPFVDELARAFDNADDDDAVNEELEVSE